MILCCIWWVLYSMKALKLKFLNLRQIVWSFYIKLCFVSLANSFTCKDQLSDNWDMALSIWFDAFQYVVDSFSFAFPDSNNGCILKRAHGLLLRLYCGKSVVFVENLSFLRTLSDLFRFIFVLSETNYKTKSCAPISLWRRIHLLRFY